MAKRMTKQRKTILEILRNTTCHPTADWIYEQARETLPEISLGTIYRNLQLLVQEHEIQELKYGSTFSRFDGNISPHYHFVCRTCGKVMDVNMDVVANLNDVAAHAVDGIVEYHRLEFYGRCQECEKEAN
ncbi:Fur family transcriptional regulator [Candidatus Formimonas warabiya]|uniref:Transcriptional repressor n=1 Tax=Formimonas warabiya TaxID=1761012 RepID=A0A3G1KRJ3_FORW1|nr:transcriptional repressor [Candidatus Formimonas warabiya]ATW25067.1 transcriptional repressor [Candidatus Formimonas warabiya]